MGKNKFLNLNLVKVRKMWKINPVSRIKPNKKNYNRKKFKQELKKGIL